MDVRVLKNFLSVAAHRSIGQAAEAAHITQPALSKSIQRLEHELGVKLFDRNGSGTKPTAYGQALIEHAGAVIHEMQRLRDSMAELREGRVGHVSVGAGAGVLEALVSRATAQLCTRLTGIRVTAIAGLAEELLPSLQRGEIDLVVGSRPTTFIDPAVSSELLFTDQIGIIVRKNHPLLRQVNAKRKLALKDIVGLPWVLPSADHIFTKSCVACFASAGLTAPAPPVMASSVTFIDTVVAATDFLTFMPISLVTGTARRDTLAQLKVPGGTWAREAYLFMRSEGTQSPAAKALAEELRKTAKR